MIGDSRFRMPPMDGDIPPDVADYLGSVGNAIEAAFKDLAAKMNDPQLIMVSTGQGMRPLSEAMMNDRWYSGDLRATSGSLASAMRRRGWVICDGRNGTPNTLGKFIVGAAAATDGGTVTTGSGVTSGPTPADTEDNTENIGIIQGEVGDACLEDVRAATEDHCQGMNGHTHAVAISAFNYFGAIWMMKL